MTCIICIVFGLNVKRHTRHKWGWCGGHIFPTWWWANKHEKMHKFISSANFGHVWKTSSSQSLSAANPWLQWTNVLSPISQEAEWHWQNELGRAASTVRCRDSQHILGAIYTLAVVQLCNRDNFADAMEVITDSTPTFQQQNWHWQIMLGDRQKFSIPNNVNCGVFNLHQCERRCTRILQMWSEWSLLLSAYNACNWTLDSEQCIVLTLKTHIEVAVTCNAT